MKKLILIIALIIVMQVPLVLALTYNAADNATFNNGYAWSGHPTKDRAKQWATDLQAITEVGVQLGTGKIWYVDSGRSASGDGKSWIRAVITLDEAFVLSAADGGASRGDVVLVAQGHSETFITQSADLDVIGIRVIGIGHGSLRPTILYNHADAEVAVGADNCSIYNFRFLSTITGVLMGIEVEDGVDYFHIEGCEFTSQGDAVGTDEFVEAINFVNNNIGCTVKGNVFNAEAAGAAHAIFCDADTSRLSIIGNDIRGDYSVACIGGDTTAVTDLLIHQNILINGSLVADGGINAVASISLLDASAGLISKNIVVSDVATALLMRVADDMTFVDNDVTDRDGDEFSSGPESTGASVAIFVDGG
jgi:hypothetical protein